MPDRPVTDFLCSLRTKRTRRKEARPAELLQAALDLFVEKGYAATRVDEVAARAGVSKGTLFLYFKTKEELFKAVVTHHIGGLFAELEHEFTDHSGTTPDLLRHFFRLWWERVGQTQASGIVKLVLAEGHNFPSLAEFHRREVANPGRDLIQRILERGVARGELVITDMPHTVHMLVAPLIFLMLNRHAGQAFAESPIDPQRFMETVAESLLHGLCPAGRCLPDSPAAS